MPVTQYGNEDFINYCRQCSDSQLTHVLRDEYARYKHGDYYLALVAAAERGWSVNKGERA